MIRECIAHARKDIVPDKNSPATGLVCADCRARQMTAEHPPNRSVPPARHGHARPNRAPEMMR